MKNSTPPANPAKAPEPTPSLSDLFPRATCIAAQVQVCLDGDGSFAAHGLADVAAEMAVIHFRTQPIDAALEAAASHWCQPAPSAAG